MSEATLAHARRARAAALGVHESQQGPDVLIIRYAHELLDAFPDEADEHPARGLANFRRFFAPYTEELKAAIRAWLCGMRDQGSWIRDHPSSLISHHPSTLTGVIWRVSEAISMRGEGFPFLDFNEYRQAFFLRFGAIAVAKVLCREVEVGTNQQSPITNRK